MIWRGAWASGTAYVTSDAVSHQGSSYIAVNDSTGEEPGTGSSWEILAKQGEQGPEGPGGSSGSGGGIAGTYVSQVTGPGSTEIVDTKQVKVLIAPCEPGDIVLSGGHQISPLYFPAVTVYQSGPVHDHIDPDTGQSVKAWKTVINDATWRDWTAYALCAET